MIKNMGKIGKALNAFFVSLGVIFLILILVVTYLVVVDPYNLKSFFSSTDMVGSVLNSSGSTSQSDKHPLLTPDQENTLENMGVNPASLPTEITPAMEDCFVEKLGQARVDEIIQSGEPSAVDYMKAGSCISK